MTLPLVGVGASWVPDSCTLPTEEQPLRTAEFHDLLANSVHDSKLIAPDHLQMSLTQEPGVAAKVADLAAREVQCCGFFNFSLTIAAGKLTLDLTVPQTHADVLAALVASVDRHRK